MIEIKDELYASPTALAQDDEEAAAYMALYGGGKQAAVGYLNEAAADEAATAIYVNDMLSRSKDERGSSYITFSYPLGIDSTYSANSAPYMSLDIFEYRRESYAQTRKTGYRDRTGKRTYAFSTDVITAIHLPLPGNLGYNVSNSFTEFQSIFNAISDANWGALSEDVKNGIAAATGVPLEELMELDAGSLSAAVSTAAPLLKNMLLGGGIRAGAANSLKQASLQSGTALNPMAEMKYIAPDIMTHQFDYTLIPTNEEEGKVIRGIIKTLREFSTGGTYTTGSDLVLKYPALFNISFLANDGSFIKGLMRIPDCYLANFSVVYNPIGQGRLMKDNTPTSYRISMTFKLTKALTRNDLKLYDPYDYESEGGLMIPMGKFINE